jgi:hypothetical protein
MDPLTEAIKHPLFSLFTFVVGCILTGLAFILALRDRMPRYAIARDNILKQKLPKLKVHYHGYGPDMEDVSVTYVCFWNAGRGTISAKDVVTTDPVKVTVHGGAKVVDAVILKVSRDHLSLDRTISQDKSHVTVEFHHLDHQDGLVLCVVHTGEADVPVTVTGTIVGTGLRGIQPVFHHRKAMMERERLIHDGVMQWGKRFLWFVCGLAFVVLFWGTALKTWKIKELVQGDHEQEIADHAKDMGTLSMAAAGAAVAPIAYYILRRTPRRLPSVFREYDGIFNVS